MTQQLKRVMLSSVELFCLVAERKSFSQAAMVAGLTPAAVSRSIARLEQRLNTQLFIRSTRQVRLTDSGEVYFQQCRQALNQIIDAEQLLKNQHQQLSGKIRISVPTPYGHYRILPLLPLFMQRYPEIQIDIQLTNTNIDFINHGFDLAIRGRHLKDSNLIARTLEQAELVVVASPEYLESKIPPNTIQALDQHECIQFILPSTGKNVPWLFKVDDRIIEYATTGKIQCLDDILGTVTLAKQGAGLLQTYRFIVEQELQNGQLVELLSPFAGTARPFSLLYPSQKYASTHIRTFIDFLMAHLKTDAS
ncbi:LysR family transcriptional regulator [Acinetobacter sp. NIPH 2699]|uniref:LysR family transcriptional regulator n=1 Tax=Acinetobacter sp. NIPH 2699 TaxID=2923433 RepID=UPI001F4AFF76|nr:LysR family transcriptional regulator [Acinetobacter sp. NIPH 2699]MCH7336016.1 LysR substrate-binding domain-containing protein [Acinetobacter sp. NIPH 2699]